MHREQYRMQNIWQARRAELQDLAGKDELTQLQNRRFFYEEIEQELELAARFKRPLSILMMDVDDLKLINDEFGHQVGDVVLRAFGRVMNQQVGEQDITARIGGDEFAIIMPGADRARGRQAGLEDLGGALEGRRSARPSTPASSSASRSAPAATPGAATRWKRSSTGPTRSSTPTSWSARASSTRTTSQSDDDKRSSAPSSMSCRPRWRSATG